MKPLSKELNWHLQLDHNHPATLCWKLERLHGAFLAVTAGKRVNRDGHCSVADTQQKCLQNRFVRAVLFQMRELGMGVSTGARVGEGPRTTAVWLQSLAPRLCPTGPSVTGQHRTEGRSKSPQSLAEAMHSMSWEGHAPQKAGWARIQQRARDPEPGDASGPEGRLPRSGRRTMATSGFP